MVVCLGIKTSRTLTVDRVAIDSFRVGIKGRSDSDWDPDPDPPSDSSGVDSIDFSSESSNLMGGVGGFVFR